MSNHTQSILFVSTRPSLGHGMITRAENKTTVFQASYEIVSSMVPVFIFIAVVAILGNLMVVFLFVKNRTWLKKAHSNLILAMAVSDILTAVCILSVPRFVLENNVYSVSENFIARELYCRIVWSHYVVFSLGVTSVYTCLSLAVERWLAIAKPVFYKQHIHTRRNITLMVLLPWLAGFTFEASALIRTSGVVYPDGSADCRWNPDTSEWPARVAIAVVSFLGMIMIPGFLVVLTYVRILIKIKGTIKRRNSQERRHSRSKTDFKRITGMAGVASVTLIICWLPGQFYFMLGQMDYVTLDVIEHRWLNVLMLSSACLNPFIYAFWNPNYREGFKNELAWLVCWKRSGKAYSLTSQSKDNSCAMVGRRSGEQSPPPTEV